MMIQPESAVMWPMAQFRYLFVLVALMTFLVVLLLSINMIRRSLTPLERLKESTRRIARKDFSGNLEMRSGDELEELAAMIAFGFEHGQPQGAGDLQLARQMADQAAVALAHVIDFMHREAHRQFDPLVVDALMENLSKKGVGEHPAAIPAPAHCPDERFKPKERSQPPNGAASTPY